MRNAAFAAVLFLLAGCSQPAPFTPVPDLKSQIDANNLAWAAAANRADPIAVAYLYTETATMLPPGMDMQRAVSYTHLVRLAHPGADRPAVPERAEHRW